MLQIQQIEKLSLGHSFISSTISFSLDFYICKGGDKEGFLLFCPQEQP